MKKFSKRILTEMFTAIIIFSMMMAEVPIVKAGISGDYEFSVSGGNATITAYKGSGGAISIPSTIEGYPVTTIGPEAFYGCSTIKSVIIPEGVTTIATSKYPDTSGVIFGAFANCKSLTSVTLPQSLTKIGDKAFRYSPINDIKIPDNVTSIESYAFANTAISKITIPNTVKTIGSGLFYECYSLEYVDLSNKIGEIPYNTFKDCKKLKSFIIPHQITKINGDAFSGCSEISTVVMTANVNYISPTAFRGCNKLTIYSKSSYVKEYAVNNNIPFAVNDFNFTISNGSAIITDYIGNDAAITIPDTLGGYPVINLDNEVASSITLTSVTIGSNVTSINPRAFGNIEFVVNEMNSTYSSKDGLLYNKAGTSLLYYPSTRKGNYEIPSSVTEVGANAFEDCNELTGVTIPEGVKIIGDNAFKNCTALTSITIGSGVSSIGKSAFTGCTGLSNLTIPSSVSNIPNNAFSNCSNLTSIIIPNSVTTIEDSAFNTCPKLISAFFQGNAPQMGTDVFAGSAKNFKVHYIKGATGFSNPWNEYKTTTSQSTSSFTIIPIVAAVGIIAIAALMFLFIRKKNKQKLQLNEIKNSKVEIAADDEDVIDNLLNNDLETSDIWTCDCGIKNDADSEFCGNCGNKKQISEQN